MTAADCSAATAELKSLIQAGKIDDCAAVMKKIKLSLIKLGGSAADVAAAISALETFIVHSVKSKDDEAFGRYFAQLRSYYARTTPDATPDQPKVLGLNLLRLLVDNRLAEFHSELELIPEQFVDSPHVGFPVQLERSLMEGLYKKVLQARQHFPDPLFSEYLAPLEDAVRYEISQCAAASYRSLQLDAAVKLFNFSSHEDLLDYCEDFEDWKVEDGRIQFPEKKEAQVSRDDIPSRRTIGEVLAFASRLEQIV